MQSKQANTIVALDLEGTLISNAVSQFPRSGLNLFLEYCYSNFPRFVMFTAVSEPLFRRIAITLLELGEVPSWFADMEYVEWHGQHKDISFIPNIKGSQQVLLVDDRWEYIKPGQENNWIYIPEYEYPYSQTQSIEFISEFFCDSTKI